MRIRYKSLAIICLMLVAMVIIVYAISQLILVNSYSHIEEQDVRSKVTSGLSEINFTLSQLQSAAMSYANSDDTYAYMQVQDTGYISMYAADNTLANLRLNFLILVDQSGRVIFEKGYNLSSKRQAPLPAGIIDNIESTNRLLASGGTAGVEGILMSGNGPLLVCAYHIRTTYGLGTPRGTAIVGRYLDADELNMLKNISGIRMSVRPFGETDTGISTGGDGDLIDGRIAVSAIDDDTISGDTIVRDVYGAPALVFHVETDRPVHRQAQMTLLFLTLAVLVAGLLICVLTIFLMENIIISRIARLDRSISKIGKENDLSGRVPAGGNDELSGFAETINRTLDALENSRRDLYASEQQFRSRVENIKDVIWETDADSRITYISPNIGHLTGYSPEELAGRSLRDLLEEEDAERIAGVMKTLRQQPDNFSLIDARLKDRNGGSVDMEFGISPIIDPDGGMTGYRGVARDIRERKHVEKALRKWADIFQHAKIAIVVCGGESVKFEMANPALAKIYGFTVDEMIGMKAKSVVAPECCNGFLSGIRTARSEGHHTFESIHVRKDGTKFPVIVDITVARDAGGKVLYQIINIQDITERKRTEKQIMDSLHEKDVLLKEIHHRVKNNLQIISSLLNLQSETTGREYAAIFKESQNRIRSMALIHEKLYQAKDFSHIDYAEYVRSLTAYLSRSYRIDTGVDISVEIENATLGIDTAIPCGLIINELVSNSLKYAFRDRHTGKINISMARDGKAYTLSVGDNGVGLPQDLDFRNTSSLGLQLVNTLVRQLEGTIELDSSGGTRFKITFAEIE